MVEGDRSHPVINAWFCFATSAMFYKPQREIDQSNAKYWMRLFLRSTFCYFWTICMLRINLIWKLTQSIVQKIYLPLTDKKLVSQNQISHVQINHEYNKNKYFSYDVSNICSLDRWTFGCISNNWVIVIFCRPFDQFCSSNENNFDTAFLDTEEHETLDRSWEIEFTSW